MELDPQLALREMALDLWLLRKENDVLRAELERHSQPASTADQGKSDGGE